MEKKEILHHAFHFMHIQIENNSRFDRTINETNN